MPKFKFSLKSKDKKARAGILETRHGLIKTPVFMPVGTHGSVKGIFPKDNIQKMIFNKPANIRMSAFRCMTRTLVTHVVKFKREENA